MPYKAVVKRECCFDQTRIVYDASARSNESSPSLNDCLEVGPPLQNQLWSVLVRERSHAIALTADIRMTFLQVRTHPDDRDALRFHWPENKGPLRVCILRFKRALFVLGRSPFLLGGVIQDHDTHSVDLLNMLSWGTLENRRSGAKSVLMYKILNDHTAPGLRGSSVRREIDQTITSEILLQI